MSKNFLLICTLLLHTITNAQTKRVLVPSDVYRLQDVGSAQVSPDGKWVAYVVTSVDSAKDEHDDNIWMISWDGTQNIQLTYTNEDESSPKWSPDGKYLSFLSSRKIGDDDADDDKDLSQLWLLDRRGGEAKKITNVTGDIEDYAWSPDGSKIVFEIKDQDFSDTASTKIRKPYVTDRYRFKQDYVGYLERRYTHVYLFDLQTKNMDTLTTGNYDEADAVFSPDGTQIAFTSNRSQDPDANENTDICVMDAKPGATIKQLTTWAGTDHSPQWSPDGKYIAYLQSSSNEAFTMYGQDIIAVIAKDGGQPMLISKSVDRPFMNEHWSKDGKSIVALMEDDRQSNVVSFDVATGAITKLSSGDRATFDLTPNYANNAWVAQMTEPHLPLELFTIENGNTRRLTHVQDSFLAPLDLPTVEGFKCKSKDGTDVSGILYKPADAKPGEKLPFILYIHGGPVGQDDYEFDMVAQAMASAGYAVAQVNYRGSSGRGVDYIRSIYADWGHKEIIDLEGAVDYLIKQGIIDENRMGVVGWSYGGISTDYMIATDQRFKAACSGAGSALQLSMYGTDEYITQYNTELGAPWKEKNLEKWLKVSYAFFKADQIKTPTLFMASQKDFNVPVAGAEQMYQALKTNGIPTELVIYPNQNHGIIVPSYQVDKYTRYIEWFNKYLK